MVVRHQYEMPLWMKRLFAVVGALNILAIITAAALLISNNTTDSSQGSEIRAQTTQIAALVSAQHQDQLAGCARGNDSRVAEIINLRADLLSLRSDLALLEKAVAFTANTPFAVVYRTAISAKKFALAAKRRAIHQTIAAQSAVAVKPGSPIVDCSHKAYPLRNDQSPAGPKGPTGASESSGQRASQEGR